MLKKIKQTGKNLLFSLLCIAVYGIVLYFVFTWLAGYSLLFAYLGNLALIVLVLAIDEHMVKIMQSDKFVMQLKKEKDPEKSYHTLQFHLDNFSSFKTDLYVFYILILVVSQIMEFHIVPVNENLGNFILANSYSIILLIALDMLIRQFTNDRARMKKISEMLKRKISEGD